jgi:hypothetical protein
MSSVPRRAAQDVVVHGGDGGGERDGVDRVEARERGAQVVVEEPLVLEDGHDLAVAQRRHLAHHRVAAAGEFGLGGEVAEDVDRCRARRGPRVLSGALAAGRQLGAGARGARRGR